MVNIVAVFCVQCALRTLSTICLGYRYVIRAVDSTVGSLMNVLFRFFKFLITVHVPDIVLRTVFVGASIRGIIRLIIIRQVMLFHSHHGIVGIFVGVDTTERRRGPQVLTGYQPGGGSKPEHTYETPEL
jgi:hypothetical protein